MNGLTNPHVPTDKYEPGMAESSGLVQTVREFKGHAFLNIRGRLGELQVVLDKSFLQVPTVGSFVRVRGEIIANPKAKGGIELQCREIRVISSQSKPPPFQLDRKIQGLPDNQQVFRAVTLRNRYSEAIFRCQSAIGNAFRDQLNSEGFIEIHSPKLVGGGTEGGSEVFTLNYFGRQASLAQSPQLYKQIACGAFRRVYEVAPVFRAENSNTSRHLTEFTGLDFETVLDRDQHEIMDLEERFIDRSLHYLAEFSAERELLDIEIPEKLKIPRISWEEGNALVEKHRTARADITHDKAVGIAAQIEFKSRFLFVYGYPEEEKPFYILPSPKPGFTESFDFLIDGLEVSSGGQRINNVNLLTERMTAKGLLPSNYPGYLMAFEYGMPEHGGAGLGLERVTQVLLKLGNVRDATLFARDPKTIDP